jgi:hypothetical protein
VWHTQMYPAMKEDTKKSTTQASLEEFLVNSIFHKTKIRTINIKMVTFSIFVKKIINYKL